MHCLLLRTCYAECRHNAARHEAHESATHNRLTGVSYLRTLPCLLHTLNTLSGSRGLQRQMQQKTETTMYSS